MSFHTSMEIYFITIVVEQIAHNDTTKKIGTLFSTLMGHYAII